MPDTRKSRKKVRVTMSVAALAVFLREELSRQNITQEQFAETTGIPDSTLSRILNGTVGEPRASQIAKIGKALKIDFWVLMRKAGIGDGPPAGPDEEAQEVAALVARDPNLADILRKSSRLNPANRRAIRAYAKMLLDQQGGLDEPQAPQGSE